MAKNNEVVNVEELRAQLEAQIRAEVEAEAKEKIEKEAEKRKEVEKKLKDTEKNIEAQLKKDEKNVKQLLAEMKKVTIEIPEDPNNPDDVVPIGWNGVIYAIPRGQEFEVPSIIAEIWKDSYSRTKEANKRMKKLLTKEIEIY